MSSARTCGAVETIVDDITNPDHVAVDDASVYWTAASGVIARAPKSGGAGETPAGNEGGAGGLRAEQAKHFQLQGPIGAGHGVEVSAVENEHETVFSYLP